MPSRYSHAIEKFWLATIDLSQGSGNLRSRLKNVFSSYFIAINENSIPDSLKSKYRNIMIMANKYKSDNELIGDIDYTLSRLSGKSMQKIAREIAIFAFEIQEFEHEKGEVL